MTKTNMDLSQLLAKQDGGDFLRAVAEAVLQLIMEADVEGLIHWPAGDCEAIGREAAPASTSGQISARPGGTGIESALSIPVWAR